MTTAQPGQEQRMELTVEAVARALAVADGANPDADWRATGDVFLTVAVERPQTWRLYTRAAVAALQQMPGAARPTADLGEDLAAMLYQEAGQLDDLDRANAIRQAADRLILYREALEKIAGHEKSGEAWGEFLDRYEEVCEIARAVLSRSGG